MPRKRVTRSYRDSMEHMCTGYIITDNKKNLHICEAENFVC